MIATEYINNSNWTRSSKRNPCPICGRTKDQDCSWKDDVKLCHTYVDQDASVSNYVYRGATKDGMWGQYFPQEEKQHRQHKSIRPKGEKEFFYPDSDRQSLVKVIRIDDGENDKDFKQYRWNGKRWVIGLGDPNTAKEVKSKIHLYLIQHPVNSEAIATGQPILIVEGEGIVELLLKMGIAATTNIGGGGQWRGYGYPNYLKDLEGANVVLCPDWDTKGVQRCEEIAKDFPSAKWLYAYPDFPYWELPLPEKDGLDIADWLEDYKELSREDILAAIGDKRPLPNKDIKQSTSSAQRQDSEDKPCTLARQFQEVKAVLGDQLRLNTLKKQIELDGEALNPDRITLKLANDFNLHISRANALDIVTELAEQSSYSPVVQYLDSVSEKYGNSSSILDDLASRYFGTDNPIYDTYLRKTLVAAVARVMQPGCKVDTALILQGKQGVGKSTFFKVLASEDWFDDSLGQISDKDERLKLHVAWLIEWAELESVFKRRDLASVKAFLTSTIDNIRPPYGRSVQAFKRPSIIVGTTNQDEFLGDPTGNRRFWIVPVQQTIDLVQLRQERDRIWAAAVALYRAGEPWWLSPSDEQLSSALVAEYQISDPWQEAIAEFIAGRDMVTITEVLDRCIELDLERQDRSHEMRVARILTQLLTRQ